jgi:hypothetical protein
MTSQPAMRVDSLPYPEQIAYWRRHVRGIFIRLGLLSGDSDTMPTSEQIRTVATKLERDQKTYTDGVELRTADATILWLEAAIDCWR